MRNNNQRKGYRYLSINNKTWQWVCGKRNVVAYCIDNKNQEKRLISLSALTGWSLEDIEGSRHIFHISPKMVKNWLVGNMLPEAPLEMEIERRCFRCNDYHMHSSTKGMNIGTRSDPLWISD